MSDRDGADITPPAIFLTGCQPWPPRNWGDRCPVCKAGIRSEDHSTYCGWSDEMSPRREAEIRAARIGVTAESVVESDERKFREDLTRQAKTHVLTERERRQIFLGNSPLGLRSPNPHVVNRAKIGRDWLAQINQLPRWHWILDADGRKVGEYETEVAPPDESDAA